jgi:RNA-binding protein
VALTSKQTRYLRSLAHHLKPVVQIGGRGLTVALIGATDDALEAHELIKVKLGDIDDRSEVRAAAGTLSEETGSDVVQTIGKTIVLFRQREKDSEIRLP